MNFKYKAIIGLLCFGMSVMGQNNSQLVQEMFAKTGIGETFANLDGMIQSKIEEKKSMFSPQQFDQFKTIMTSGFNSKSATNYFTEYFNKFGNKDSMQLVINLYNDPMMQEFNQMEKAAAAPEKQAEMMAYFQSFKTNPPAQGRIMQLAALNEEMNTSEMMVKMIENMAVAMAKGANRAQTADKQVTEAEIIKSIQDGIPATFKQQMTNQIVGMMLFTYQHVDDKKLSRYLEVWKTPTGKYCMQSLMKGFDYAFVKMGENMATSLSKMAK